MEQEERILTPNGYQDFFAKLIKKIPVSVESVHSSCSMTVKYNAERFRDRYFILQVILRNDPKKKRPII